MNDNFHCGLKIIVRLILIAILTGGALAQDVWDMTLGGPNYDTGFSVIEIEDSSFLVTGDLQSNQGVTDGWLLGISTNGDSLWSRTYGDVSQDGFYVIQSTEEENYLILGYTYLPGNSYSDAWILKVDQTGDVIWSEVLGGDGYDELYSMVQTSEGNTLFCGNSRSYGAGESDGWLIMMNSEGDTLWTRTYGADRSDYANYIIESSDEAYLFIGTTESFNSTTRNIWMVKIELTGEVRWMRVFNAAGSESGRTVIETDENGYMILAGTQTGALVIRTDVDGDTLWTRRFGNNYPTNENLIAVSLIETSDDSFVLLGLIATLSSDMDIQIIKFDSNGDTIWSKNIGGEGRDIAYEIIETSDRGYLIVGSTQSFGSGGSDVWLIKTDSLGNTSAQTSLKDLDLQRPEFYLYAYPNPFNSALNFEYILPMYTDVSIEIYAINGKEIYSRKLLNQPSGKHHYQWQFEPEINSGIYILRLSTGLYSETRKLTLIK